MSDTAETAERATALARAVDEAIHLYRAGDLGGEEMIVALEEAVGDWLRAGTPEP
jgi:hypothetical protein